jgi:hypothetical protein
MKRDTITLPADLVAEFDKAQAKHEANGNSKPWTPETDEVIRRYWRKVRHAEFLAIFEKRFFKAGKSAITERARKLGA